MDKYYYEYKDDGDVKYCYQGTQVLVNKLDIRNGKKLSKAEREISIVKAAVLADAITGNFDLVYLKSIHKFLFEDIYDWAGEIRTVDIAKGNIFCLVQFIEIQFSELYEKLKQDNFLKGEKDIFSMVDEREMLEASVDSFMCSYEKMEALIRNCIKEVKIPE